jgi:hypothetical protein
VQKHAYFSNVFEGLHTFQGHYQSMWDAAISALLHSPTVLHEPELSTAHEDGGAISSQVSARLRQCVTLEHAEAVLPERSHIGL